jgi:hypothetical protein
MEAAGTVPSDLVERLKGIGVFRMFVPHTAERATRPHQAPKRPGACSLTYRNLRPRSLGNLRANLDVVRGKLAGLIVRVPVEGVVTAKVSYLCSHPRRQRTTLSRREESRSPPYEVNCNSNEKLGTPANRAFDLRERAYDVEPRRQIEPQSAISGDEQSSVTRVSFG